MTNIWMFTTLYFVFNSRGTTGSKIQQVFLVSLFTEFENSTGFLVSLFTGLLRNLESLANVLLFNLTGFLVSLFTSHKSIMHERYTNHEFYEMHRQGNYMAVVEMFEKYPYRRIKGIRCILDKILKEPTDEVAGFINIIVYTMTHGSSVKHRRAEIRSLLNTDFVKSPLFCSQFHLDFMIRLQKTNRVLKHTPFIHTKFETWKILLVLASSRTCKRINARSWSRILVPDLLRVLSTYLL